MHKDWCGKPCTDCAHPCSLDESIPCSPDCEYLGPNGERNHRECKTCDAWRDVTASGEQYKTSAGTITTCFYDDGIAKGIQIMLDGEVVAILDVYEPVDGETEGEARVLVYKKDGEDDVNEEPFACISVNR